MADEEKKGNVRLSNQIRDAYFGKNTDSTLVGNLGKRSKKNESSFSAKSVDSLSITPSPFDKDSLLELFEIIRPSKTFSAIVLPKITMVNQAVNHGGSMTRTIKCSTRKSYMKHHVHPINAHSF